MRSAHPPVLLRIEVNGQDPSGNEPIRRKPADSDTATGSTEQDGGAAPGGQGDCLTQALPFLLILGVFWFLLILPQRKQEKQRKEMLAALKKGDRIVTTGGVHATVAELRDDTVVVRINNDGVRMTLDKSAIGRRPAEPKADTGGGSEVAKP